MKYGYIRVSTINQDYARQQFALNGLGIPTENIFEEKISGTKKASSRPEFEKMLDKLLPNDICYFESMSRMARSMKDLIDTTNMLVKDKKIQVVFLKENIIVGGSGNTADAMNTLIFNIMGAFAQFERDLIADRTKQGLQAKKQQGVVLGKPKKQVDEKSIIAEYNKGTENSIICEMFTISEKVLTRVIRDGVNNGLCEWKKKRNVRLIKE